MQVPPKINAIYIVIFAPAYKRELKYEGYAKSFSSTNDIGTYDILPNHENFVSVALGTAVIVDENSRRLNFNLGKAVVEASENVLKVYVDY